MNTTTSMMPLEAHRLFGWLKKRDRAVAAHSLRVSQLALALGRHLGVPARQLWAIEQGACFHDLGKSFLPTKLIHKAGALSTEETTLFRKHPTTGANLLAFERVSEEVQQIAALHHERWDGTGYPNAIHGDSIPLAARIVTVVDAFDAMISYREYRESLSEEDALLQIALGAGGQFCPVVAEAFITLCVESRSAEEHAAVGPQDAHAVRLLFVLDPVLREKATLLLQGA